MCEKITAGEFYTIVTRLQKKWWGKNGDDPQIHLISMAVLAWVLTEKTSPFDQSNFFTDILLMISPTYITILLIPQGSVLKVNHLFLLTSHIMDKMIFQIYF